MEKRFANRACCVVDLKYFAIERLEIVQRTSKLVQEPGSRPQIDEPAAMPAGHLLFAGQKSHGLWRAPPACRAGHGKQDHSSKFICHEFGLHAHSDPFLTKQRMPGQRAY